MTFRMVSSASALALSGFAWELLCNAFEGPRSAFSPARILFNENPLGPSLKALDAMRNAGDQFSRYPLGQGPELAMKLRKINGMPYKALSGELSLVPAATPEGSHELILGVGSSEILRAAAWAYCFDGGNVVEAYPSYSAIGSAAL